MTDANDADAGWQGFAAERLTFFSDAVVAIAITLLALELPVPGDVSTPREFWHLLAKGRNDYIAFLISFAAIGSHWFLHHNMFSRVARLSGPLVRWNTVWLLMIVLTPFATRVIVADGAFAERFTIYAAVQGLAAAVFLLAVIEMDRHHLLREGTDRGLVTRNYHRLSVMAGAFLVSIPIAYATRWAYACWIAVPVLWRVRTLVVRWRGAMGRRQA